MMIDVTDASFQSDVLERSMTTPVVVDLWAPWCGPCTTLGPMLEKVVDETNGRVVLAKVNVDENPQVSAAFQVQSIPAVYAVSGGQMVDGFIGAQPEAAIRAFVDKLAGAADPGELQRLVAAGDEESLRQALELDPSSVLAAFQLAALLIDADRAAEAIPVLEALPADAVEDPQVQGQLATLLDVARARAVPTTERERITTRLVELLDVVKGDDDARQEFVDLLAELAPGDPSGAADWRRKLATRLY
ncbi:MAG: thioredoxin family protein [Acidimicrobiales bacterium]